jgi:hypothetical protein
MAAPAKPSMFAAAKEGLGLGFGLSAGKAVFEGIFGGPKAVAPAPTATPMAPDCTNQQKEYQDCRILHGADSYCFDQLKALSECRKVI